LTLLFKSSRRLTCVLVPLLALLANESARACAGHGRAHPAAGIGRLLFGRHCGRGQVIEVQGYRSGLYYVRPPSSGTVYYYGSILEPDANSYVHPGTPTYPPTNVIRPSPQEGPAAPLVPTPAPVGQHCHCGDPACTHGVGVCLCHNPACTCPHHADRRRF
jgi:hypothetical protein